MWPFLSRFVAEATLKAVDGVKAGGAHQEGADWMLQLVKDFGVGGVAKDLFPNCPVSQKYWEKKAKPSKGTLGFKCKRAAKAQAPWLRLELAKGVVENWLTPNQRWSLVLHLVRKRHDRYGDGEATTRWRRRRGEWDVFLNLASSTK